MSPGERLEVWQDPAGLWRWAWVREDEGSGGHRELLSSEPAPTRDEALAEAQLAYPGIPVTDPPEGARPGPDEDAAGHHRRWPQVLATLGLAGALAVVLAASRRRLLLPLAPVLAVGVVRRLRRRGPAGPPPTARPGAAGRARPSGPPAPR